MSTWSDTQIWDALSRIDTNEAKKVRTFLSSEFCMDRIEKVLNDGNPATKDFTLHDADHSFRVAERMWEIIPPETQKILSEYELVLLLLSAYLHDIGMSPDYGKVKKHFDCLTTIEKSGLNDDEKKELQRWLDDEGEQINLEKDTIEDKDRAAELITYYCRHKHNDWSEDWIRNNFKDEKSAIGTKELGNYTSWLNDLVTICKSHHYGLEELKSDKYNPLRTHGKVIHKRYIAMCLRLADVMEIDPERAPSVLIKHRGVIDGSITHWLKEKFASVDIVNDTISVNASPTKAFIHKAILEVANQIEQEAKLCQALIGDKPLDNISPSNDLEHEWRILPSVHREVKEGGDYEYIEGTFKPNAKKILELLAGTELYGNPLMAIRELLQNAFDAVKVQIGYKGLEEKYTNPEDFEALKDRFNVELSLEKEGEDYWLICKDDGVGMDKEIIKKCFLVGGAARRRELLELERKCNEIGYDLELTGQFGIGVMSYFMIADKIIIQTQKSRQSGSTENGWEFEINGLSDFGELRKWNKNTSGSILRLRIRKEHIETITSETKLMTFFEENLVRIPCDMSYYHLNNQKIELKSGWCKNEEFFKSLVYDEFLSRMNVSTKKDQFFHESEVAEAKEEYATLTKMIEHLKAKLVFECFEGALDNGYGYFRIHIPIFQNTGGDAFVCFFEDKVNSEAIYVKSIGRNIGFLPSQAYATISWKGMNTFNSLYLESDPYYLRKVDNCFIELDIINNSLFQISASRIKLRGSTIEQVKEGMRILENEITVKVEERLGLIKEKFSSSKYNIYNFFDFPVVGFNQDMAHRIYNKKKKSHDKDDYLLTKIQFPITFDSPGFRHLISLSYLGVEIHEMEEIKVSKKYDSARHYSFAKNFAYDRVVICGDEGKLWPLLLVHKQLIKRELGNTVERTVKLPPSWKNMFCYIRSHEMLINEEHELFQYLNWKYHLPALRYFIQKQDLSERLEVEFLKNKSSSVHFLLAQIKHGNFTHWQWLVTEKRSFVEKLWINLHGDLDEVFYYLGQRYDGYLSLYALSLNGVRIFSDAEEILKIIPMPSEEWQFTFKRKITKIID